MRFEEYCRSLGLIVDHLEIGRWVRVPTVDHPRSKNGSYRYMGEYGWAQNWATMISPEMWRGDEDSLPPKQDLEVIRLRAEAERKKVKFRNETAAAKAEELIKNAKVGKHSYLEVKGFADRSGLISEDGALLVPMRNVRTNVLQGVQVIRWLPEEGKHEKRMLAGTKAVDAVLSLGNFRSADSWLCEGYATGLSVLEGLRLMSSTARVLVCFSAGNMERVGRHLMGLGGRIFVFADNDRSEAGQNAATAIGAPWVMSPVLGEDANDLHLRAGVWSVRTLLGTIKADGKHY